MPNLAELQKTYPWAKYEPQPNCPKCHGEGLWWHGVKPSEANSVIKSRWVCCMCIFVGPENMDIARGVIRRVFGKQKENGGG